MQVPNVLICHTQHLGFISVFQNFIPDIFCFNIALGYLFGTLPQK